MLLGFSENEPASEEFNASIVCLSTIAETNLHFKLWIMHPFTHDHT